MKEEIKYIIKRLEYVDTYQNCSTSLNGLEIKTLLDYITNLQKENERLNTVLNGYIDEFCKDTIKKYELVMEQEDYKSRCEKAIEHIKEHQLIYTSQYEQESNFDNHLLDILNGGDDK